jgi:hypothetical protein
MTRNPPSRHDNDHRADDHSSQSRANEQRVNTIATPPGLVPVPALWPASEGGR